VGTFVDADASSTTTSVNTLPGVTWPTHLSGDIALVGWASDDTQTPTLDGTLTSEASVADGTLRAILGSKVTTGSESGDVSLVSAGTANRQAGAIALYRGYTSVAQVTQQNETGSATTTHTGPSITPTNSGSAIVLVYLERVTSSATPISPPAGFTSRAVFATGGTGGTAVCIADKLTGNTAGTPIATGDWTSTTASANVMVYAVELLPSGTSYSLSAAGSGTTSGSAALTERLALAASGTATSTGGAGLDLSSPVPPVVSDPGPRSFRIEVFDEDLNKLGRVGKYLTADVTLKHNATGSWALLMDIDQYAASLLAAPGRRITIDFEEGGRLLSGPVDSWEEIEEINGQKTIACAGYDDKWWLDQRVAFNVPGAVFPADGVSFTQTSTGDVRTGNGETVAKGYVTANAVTRRPIPHLVVAPNLNRGTTVTFTSRMHSLAWMVEIAARNSGLGYRVDQVGTELVFDVYAPQDQPVRLSKRLGNLTSYRYKALSPIATHGVLGGSGAGTARKYMQKNLPASAVGWGAREKFVDATDATTDALMNARLDEFLAESAPTAGFSLTPRDTRAMRFGRDYNIGDRVAVELPGGVQVSDTVREVKLSHTSADGMVITPGVGFSESTDPTAAIYRAYAALRDRVANNERNV